MITKEEIETAHRKDLKSLEGEKRAAVKKAKGTKGKKAKQAIAAVEDDFAARGKLLQMNHEEKLRHIDGGGIKPIFTGTIKDEKPDEETRELSAKERKQLKAKKKKERQKEREIQLQKELEDETANAGPSLRDVELRQIEDVLTPLNLAVDEVDADGHCLYRAVAAQTATDFHEIRGLCADTLAENEVDFSPFCEYGETVISYGDYVNQVRNTAEWGGHLELRALSLALDRPIHVYSVQSGAEPLKIDAGAGNDDSPIRLSYHLHYYALGEHYNQVVPA